MNTFRWIFGIIISIIIAIIGTSIIEPILKLCFAIFGGYGRTGWVDMPTDIGHNLSFFNNELLPLCLASVIAYGIGGVCCGKIVPAKKGNLLKWTCGVGLPLQTSSVALLYGMENIGFIH